MIRRVSTLIVLLSIVGTFLVSRPAIAAVPIPKVSASADVLGVQASWAAVTGASGYRAWVTGLESQTSVELPADARGAYLGFPDTTTARSVSVVAIVDGSASAAGVSAAVRAAPPGGTLVVAPTPGLVLKKSLAARRSMVVSLPGTGGIPSSGVTGVWLSVDATGGKKSTTVTAAGGALSSTLTVPGKARVTRTIFVTSGQLTVKAGKGAVQVQAHALGWTRSAATSSPSGTVKTIDPVLVLGSAGNLKARQSVWVKAAGAKGIPTKGVTAAVVTLTTTGSKKPSTIGLTATGNGAGTPVLTSVPKKATQTSTVVSLDKSGRFRVVNGTQATTVSASVTAWVSGQDAVQAEPGTQGEWATVGPPKKLVTLSSRGGAISNVAVAGKVGVPSLTGSAPPTAVLLKATASTTSSTASVGVGSLVASLRPLKGRPDESALWVPLSADGTITVRNLGSTKAAVTLTVLGWNSGATLISPDTKVVTSDGADYGAREAKSGSLTVKTAKKPAVGAVLASGPTSKNPNGFLVKVLATLDNGNGTTTLTTRDASLAEAVRRGSVTQTIAFQDPKKKDAPIRGDTNRDRAKDPHASKTYELNYPFDKKFGGATAQGRLSGEAKMTLTGELSVHIGWTGLDGHATIAASESFDAKLEAEAETSWNETIDVVDIDLGVIAFSIGPVPIVMQPGIDLNAHSSGTVKGAATVEVHQSASAVLGYDLDDGIINETDSKDPSVKVTRAEASLDAEVGLEPYARMKFYDHGTLETGLPISIHADWTYPACSIALRAKLDASVIASLSILKFNKSASKTVNIFDKALPSLRLPLLPDGCFGPWKGTISISTAATQGIGDKLASSYSSKASYSDLAAVGERGSGGGISYAAAVAVTVDKEILYGWCPREDGLGDYWGPHDRMLSWSWSGRSEGMDSATYFFGNASNAAFALRDTVRGTYFDPSKIHFTTTTVVDCLNGQRSQGSHDALGYQLTGWNHQSDVPLPDKDLDPRRLVGSVTYTVPPQPYDNDPQGSHYLNYTYTVTYDLTRE